MISYLHGTVHGSKPPLVTLVVNGIGFAVHIPARYVVQKGAQVSLEIYCHMTQDHGMQLYGFETIDEKMVFAHIIGCSGLGPKIGLAVLGSLTPALFVSAVLSGDVKTLSGIDGIGAKKAESMVMQLKDKVAKLAITQDGLPGSQSMGHVKQLSDVLGSLGYSRQEITAALEHLRQNGLLQQASFEEIVRKGLGFLSKK
jgi:holliday junction DNA helicase RuvA